MSDMWWFVSLIYISRFSDYVYEEIVKRYMYIHQTYTNCSTDGTLWFVSLSYI